MRLQTKKIKAEDCPTDVFVYFPFINLFFFVDAVEVTYDDTTLIHEIGISERGLEFNSLTFENDCLIEVVSEYTINEKIF